MSTIIGLVSTFRLPLQKPTRREVNICFVGYFEEKVLQMC